MVNKIANSTSVPLSSAISWRIALDLISRGTFFLLNIFIARSLGVGEFGKFSYAVSLAQSFYIFTDFGTHIQMIKDLGDERGKNKNSWVYFYQLKLIFYFVCALLFFLSVFLFWHWDNMLIPTLALVWMFSNSALDFGQFACNGLGRMDLAKNMMLIHRGLTLAGGLGSVYIFRSVVGTMLGMSLGGAIGAVISTVYFHRRAEAPKILFWAPREWKRIFIRAIPNGIAGAFGAWYLRVGFIVLGWMATSQVIGEYSTAFRFFEMAYIIPAAMMGVSVPYLAEAFLKGREVFFHQLRHLARLTLGLAALWLVSVFVLAPFLVEYIYGSDFMGAVPVLRVFSLVGVMVFFNYLITHLIVVINGQKRHAIHQFLVFTCCFLASLHLISKQGALGAAWGIFFAELILFILTATYLWRFFKTHSWSPITLEIK